jgi:hypothetical protein
VEAPWPWPKHNLTAPKTQRLPHALKSFAQKSSGPPLRRATATKLVALASGAALLAALAGLVLAAVLAALTALTTLATLATLMLLAGPVLSALSALAALAAALLRTLLLLLVTLRVVLLVRHWEILRCLFGNAPPRRNVINARQKLKRRKPVTTDTVNEL